MGVSTNGGTPIAGWFTDDGWPESAEEHVILVLL